MQLLTLSALTLRLCLFCHHHFNPAAGKTHTFAASVSANIIHYLPGASWLQLPSSAKFLHEPQRQENGGRPCSINASNMYITTDLKIRNHTEVPGRRARLCNISLNMQMSSSWRETDASGCRCFPYSSSNRGPTIHQFTQTKPCLSIFSLPASVSLCKHLTWQDICSETFTWPMEIWYHCNCSHLQQTYFHKKKNISQKLIYFFFHKIKHDLCLISFWDYQTYIHCWSTYDFLGQIRQTVLEQSLKLVLF